MGTRIDHLVWGAPDLAGLVADAERMTGVAPVLGGVHEGRGTRNFLIGLGPGRYLELIGPDPEQPTPSRPRPFGVDSLTGPKLIGWAVRTDAMAQTVQASRTAGYDPGDADRMSRRQPDGPLLEWLLTPPQGGYDGTVPFVIDWLDSPHPSASLPAVGLTSLTLRHPDADGIARALGAMELHDRADIEIERGSPPGLRAVLDTPHGTVSIR